VVAWGPDLLPSQPGWEPAPAPPLQVLRRLASSPRGLDEAQAQIRLARFGENVIAAGRQPSWAARALTAIRNPFVAILICLTVVSEATGDLAGYGLAIIAARSAYLRRRARWL
jgi:P-type Mg2+ transporter